MPSPLLQELTDEVAEEVTIMNSATVLINGFAARLQAGIDAALAGGATAEELAVLSTLKTDLDTQGTALAAAVSANTPEA